VDYKREQLQKTARIVSVLGHPFVLLPCTVLIASLYNLPPHQAFTIAITTILITVFPILFIIRRRVAAGKWSDHDVSVVSERNSFYPILLLIVSSSSLIFWLLEFPRSLLIGMLISLGLLFIAMHVNRRSKISLHMIFAAYCAVSLMAVSYWIGGAFLLFTVMIGWSRVVLERHSLPQVLSGMILGMTAGILLLKLVNFI
jgi:membrane-associated phospholipid phosphatase